MEPQSGFRKGRSTQDHIFTIKELITKTLQQGKRSYIAFIDLEKAFDRVPRNKIWISLKDRGVNDKLLKNIQSVYRSNVNYVIYKNMKSRTFGITGGLRQGGVLSPVLFNISWTK